MSEEKQSLQQQADRARPSSRKPVLTYLVVLFAAAFVLLLLAFFMQKRANDVAIDNLEQTSHSAAESLENVVEERDALKEEVAALEAENARLQQELTAAQSDTEAAQAEVSETQQQVAALYDLHVIRSLYLQRRYQEARDYMAQAQGRYQLEQRLEDLSTDWLSDEGRELYNPIDAYHDLEGWLS